MVNTLITRAFLFLTALFALGGCGTVDFTAPLTGKYVKADLAVKNFEVVGTVFVSSTETHSAGPFGFRVEGSKVTYSDLMQEAALINADDIIDVRIDMNAGKPARSTEWRRGWERTFTYTGRALAIKYVDRYGEDDSNQEIFRR